MLPRTWSRAHERNRARRASIARGFVSSRCREVTMGGHRLSGHSKWTWVMVLAWTLAACGASKSDVGTAGGSGGPSAGSGGGGGSSHSGSGGVAGSGGAAASSGTGGAGVAGAAGSGCTGSAPKCLAACGSDILTGETAHCMSSRWMCDAGVVPADCPNTCFGTPLLGEVCESGTWVCRPEQTQTFVVCPAYACASCEGFTGPVEQNGCRCTCISASAGVACAHI